MPRSAPPQPRQPDAAVARLATLIAGLDTGVLVEDERRLMVFANQRFCDLFGIPGDPAAMAGADCAAAARQVAGLFSDPVGFLSRVDDILLERKPVRADVLELRDGRIFERDYFPVFLDASHRGNAWQYRDVTAARTAVRELETLKRFYEQVLEAAIDGVLTAEENGTILEFNPAAEAIFGCRRADVLGRDALGLFVPNPLRDQLRAIARGEGDGSGWEGRVDTTLLRFDGTAFAAELAILPIVAANGPRVFTAFIRDVTERIHRDSELRLAKELAEQSALAKQEFLANMSHEIRTPLNAVIGLSHLLARTELDANQQRYLEGIRFSGEQLLSTISDILDLSKIESGRLHFEAAPFDPASLVRALVGTLRYGAEQRGLALVAAIDPDLPASVVGDPVRINQILLNLVGNAIKFTERGTVAVSLRVESRLRGEVALRFSVRDTGIGIAGDRVARIFEPFSQERSDTTRKFGGTGLGLAIVRQLVELQGGTISVESEPGRGSEFAVRLSFPIADQIAPERPTEPPTRLDGVRLLLVEDNEINQVVASELMQAAGATVLVASSGPKALDRLKRDPVDLVLMDLQMPGMDGFETTIRIRRELGRSEAELPILALSASALVEERRRAEAAGMNGFVGKPFQPAELVARIAEALGRGRGVVEAPGGGGAGIDRQLLNDFTFGDRDLARRIVSMYVANAPKQFDQIRIGLETRDWPLVAAVAHQLRSAAGFVGAAELAAMMGQLDEDARTGSAGQLDPTRMFALAELVLVEARTIEAEL